MRSKRGFCDDASGMYFGSGVVGKVSSVSLDVEMFC